jgi:hypothetical protein
MFWLTLTVWGTLVAVESERRWPYVVLGIGAAMAMATKEQGVGLLAGLAAAILVHRYRAQPKELSAGRRLLAAVWNPPVGAGLLATVIATLIGNNAIVNPMGVINRILDLTGHPIPGVSSRLTPLKFSLFKGFEKEAWYLRQLADVTESTFGLPLFLCAVAGVVYLAVTHRRAALVLLWPAAAYYVISLRTHDLLAVRYALPLVPILAVAAAALCDAVAKRAPRSALALNGGLCILALARAIELLVLLRTDPRYRAEEWMAANAPNNASVEYYQKPVYIPRTAGLRGTAIPLDQRTVAGVQQRQPDLIVLSSAGRKSITHFWNPVWSEGQLLVEQPEARAMLDALESGQLPYRRVATFDQGTWLLRNRITSLSPKISIFQRQTSPARG